MAIGGAVRSYDGAVAPSSSAARRDVEVAVDGGVLRYEVVGETLVGAPSVLLDADDDLLAGTPWSEAGYGVAPFLTAPERSRLVAGLAAIVRSALVRHVPEIPDPLDLATYHRFVDDQQHRAVIGDLFRDGIDVEALPVPIARIEEEVGDLLGVPVSTRCPGLGVARAFVRLARPGAPGDHNPPHRDVWLDHLRHAANAYVPLAGSTERSALGLVPGSHRWPESSIRRTAEGATLQGIRYEVPAVVGADAPLHLVRPNPQPDEILLFSPYLVHGGGINLQADTTRASLELRFWRIGGPA